MRRGRSSRGATDDDRATGHVEEAGGRVFILRDFDLALDPSIARHEEGNPNVGMAI